MYAARFELLQNHCDPVLSDGSHGVFGGHSALGGPTTLDRLSIREGAVDPNRECRQHLRAVALLHDAVHSARDALPLSCRLTFPALLRRRPDRFFDGLPAFV